MSSVAFRRDGGDIAAGYRIRDVGSVVLWDVDLQSWQRMAGQIANRNFTWAEWHQYFPDEPYHRTFRALPWPSDLPNSEREHAERGEMASDVPA